jgi:intein/homing endonuclease
MRKCVPHNVKVKEYLHEPHNWGKRKVRTFRICDTAYISSLETDYGLMTGNSYDRRVPTVLWSSPTSVVAEFLSAYFEGDGSITLTSSNTINIAAHSVSRELLQDLKLLLWEHFGILTSKVLKEKSSDEENGLKIYLMIFQSLQICRLSLR